MARLHFRRRHRTPHNAPPSHRCPLLKISKKTSIFSLDAGFTPAAHPAAGRPPQRGRLAQISRRTGITNEIKFQEVECLPGKKPVKALLPRKTPERWAGKAIRLFSRADAQRFANGAHGVSAAA
jgi:hypothetical protein